MTDSERSPNGAGRTPDFCHVKGQEAAKRALEVAAAGEHPILLIGPAGSGKTLLARCVPGLLPPPTHEEAAEIAETYRRAKLDTPPEDWGRSQGLSELCSDAEIDNATSAAAHRSLGFTEVARIVCFRKAL